MEKKFSKIQIATIKRIAQSVQQFVSKKESIDKKIAALEDEKQGYQSMIDGFQGPIKEMTGGYTTEDLVTREVVKTGKFDSKTGKEIVSTRFVLKYPETVIPVSSTEEIPEGLVNMEMPAAGSDFDADAELSSIPEETTEVISNPWE